MTANFIDLFAGIGGFHYALQRAGFEGVWASEWDKHSAHTYEQNHGLKPHGDITGIDAKDIPAHQLIAAGFPCQAFSVSGKRAGFDDARGTLFFDIARIAKEHKTPVLFLENVRNFASHDDGRTLQVVTETLENLGYNVHTQLFNASDFGLPQHRQRFFIVAVLKTFNNKPFIFPTPSHSPVRLKDVLLPNDEVDEKLFIHRDDMVIDRAEPAEPVNKPVRLGQVGKGGQGERIYSTDGHAITLSAYGGGVGGKTGLYLVDGQVRRLMPRECARVQGFPEDFIIHERRTIAWKQFGNSVPVKVLEAIAQSIKDQYFVS